ncbi:MAG: hypothetical protein FWB98_03645 [Defluviitaleaceae bacterium]|nr:hypothetical protein [Defluviitaleaceae bacterium]
MYDPRQSFAFLDYFKRKPEGKGKPLSYKAKAAFIGALVGTVVIVLLWLFFHFVSPMFAGDFVNVEGVVVQTPQGVHRIEYQFEGQTHQIVGHASRLTVGDAVNVTIPSNNPDGAWAVVEGSTTGDRAYTLLYIALIPATTLVVSGITYLFARKREKRVWGITT